jgi:hypothetical protein
MRRRHRDSDRRLQQFRGSGGGKQASARRDRTKSWAPARWTGHSGSRPGDRPRRTTAPRSDKASVLQAAWIMIFGFHRTVRTSSDKVFVTHIPRVTQPSNGFQFAQPHRTSAKSSGEPVSIPDHLQGRLSPEPALDVVVEMKLVGMGAQPDGIDLRCSLVVEPGFNHVAGEHIAAQ